MARRPPQKQQAPDVENPPTDEDAELEARRQARIKERLQKADAELQTILQRYKVKLVARAIVLDNGTLSGEILWIAE